MPKEKGDLPRRRRHLPHRGVPKPPEWQSGDQQPGVAALPAHQRLPRALGRADRHHDHPLYAVLRCICRGRQGHQTLRLPWRGGSTQ